MKKTKNKKKVNKYKTQKTKKQSAEETQEPVISYDNLEYFREAFAYFTKSGNDVYVTTLSPVIEDKNRKAFACTCSSFWKNMETCKHIKTLKSFFKDAASKTSYYNHNTFEKSHWYNVAKNLAQKDYSVVKGCKVNIKSEMEINVINARLAPVINYYGVNDGDRERFIERFTLQKGVLSRGKILDDLYLKFLSENDKMIILSGNITLRLIFEQSIWYRFAYHLHNEFQSNVKVMLSSDEAGNTFQLNGFLGNMHIFSCILPLSCKNKITNILDDDMLDKVPENNEEYSGEIKYQLKLNCKGGIDVKPIFKIMDSEGNEQLHSIKLIPAFNHNVYINNIGFVSLKSIQDAPETQMLQAKTVSVKEVPDFIKGCGRTFLDSNFHDIEQVIRDFKIYDELPEDYTIKANAVERNWCDFNINIPLGSSSIPIYEIIKLKQSKAKYCKVGNSWIDTDSESINSISETISKISTEHFDEEKIKLSKIEVLRLLSVLPGKPGKNSGEAKEQFESFIKLNPVHSDFSLKSMNCNLRHYQEIGLKWLTFLYENNFGGLLCDDMGLGKTHQIMALFTLLVEKMSEKKPFLVICPTTVISHWYDKITRFAPCLKPQVYHGKERELENELCPGTVILTSYGIIRNDIHELEKIEFGIVVFDEIQYLKNKNTVSYKSAKRLNFVNAFGLSGTPIENRLSELKSLMDLVLPGYLGSDYGFTNNFIKPIENEGSKTLREKLAKMISPFVLRRLKDSVLSELPPKIEDVRSCELSSEQIDLYSKSLVTQGKNLRDRLDKASTDKEIPYLHIFALLGLLKQICNHPALVAEDFSNYRKYTSGKWEVFKEIIGECIEGGHKVVVFTQFLGMIEIMENYLKEENVEFVTLTGKSVNRGKIIKKFNEDEDCKVFLGSLKAGGTGIDLVAASIVIHYDRWWNAAREEQATDRVHRIGQTRGVQVFKFVTKNSLEEKIAEIIERKRNLMTSVVKDDSADSLKTFSKAELYELLSEME